LAFPEARESEELVAGADCDPEERIRFSPPTAPFRLRRHRIAILVYVAWK
jgi:hypothetical protein